MKHNDRINKDNKNISDLCNHHNTYNALNLFIIHCKNQYGHNAFWVAIPFIFVISFNQFTHEFIFLYVTFTPFGVPVLPDVVTIDHLAQDIKDLTSVPVGVDVDSKLSATYDFTKDKINKIR